MRVLVTGAFGFIGTAVGRRLALAGHDVVAVTSRPLGTAPTPLFPCQVVRADLRDEGSVRAALADARPDAVCHLAGLGKVRESFQRPEEYHAVNAGGTRTLLDALTATAPHERQHRHVTSAVPCAVGCGYRWSAAACNRRGAAKRR
jgi:UDP-glucose 4-epimerase